MYCATCESSNQEEFTTEMMNHVRMGEIVVRLYATLPR
jgi:hypothetical protein